MKFKIVFAKENRYYVNGEEVTKAEFDVICPSKPLHAGVPPATLMQTSAAWPLLSDSMGCDPTQIDHFQNDSIKRGVPTEFDKEGRAIFLSNAHKRDYAKAYGYPNRDGGYGQITG